MSERDKLIKEYDPNNKLYIVTPTPMLEYMDKVRNMVLKYPDMVVLVPSNDLNPEPQLYFDD